MYSFWPEFQVGSDLYFLRWEAREDVYSYLTLGPLSSRSSVNTTTSTARRLQRQRAQDRALTQLARAHRRLSAHHGSADMSWKTRGKGKGYYQYIPGWVGEASSWGWDDAKGGGKGSKGQTSKGKGNSNHLTVDKDLLTIESCHAALREKDAEHKRLKAETAKVINQNKQFLANMERKTAKDKPPETDAAEGELLCPKCGTAHTNLSKYRCRMMNCKAILRPKADELGTDLNDAKHKKPKDPLQTNFMQALLARHNAKELLLDNEDEPSAGATEASQDVEMAEPPAASAELDSSAHRIKLEGILQTLKDVGAPAETIRAQERAIAALPKPKTPKTEKPLLDAAHFSRALSQAKEHHQEVAEQDRLRVEACQLAIERAQANMQSALQDQKDHAAYAEMAMNKLRALIAKTQEDSKEVFQVAPAAAKPTPEESPDFQLLLAEFLSSVNPNLKAAPHLQTFVENIQFVPRSPAAANKAAPPAAEKTAEAVPVDKPDSLTRVPADGSSAKG